MRDALHIVVARRLGISCAALAPLALLLVSWSARAQRLLRDATARFEVMQIPPLAAPDVTDSLAPAFNGYEQMPTDDMWQLAPEASVALMASHTSDSTSARS